MQDQDGAEQRAAIEQLRGRRPESIEEARQQQRRQLEALEAERRRQLSGPVPEGTVQRPTSVELEGALSQAIAGQLEPIRAELRALGAALRDELLATRVREIAARLDAKARGSDPTPAELLEAWGEIVFVIELEDAGRPKG